MSEKITFQELIESIADQTNNSKQFTHDFLKDFVAVINNGLESDGTISIAGFGKFKLRAMAEREGYNPQTGEKITIPAHNKIVFKPYKDVRELVNAPYRHLKAELLDDEAGEDTTTEKEENRKPALLSPSEPRESGQKTAEEKREKAPWEQSPTEAEDDNFDPESPSDKENEEKELTGLQPDGQQENFEDDDIVEYSPAAKTKSIKYKTAGSSSGPIKRYDPDELRQMASSSPSVKRSRRWNKQSQNRIWLIAAACIALLLVAGTWYFTSSSGSYDLMITESTQVAGDSEQQQDISPTPGQTNPPVTSSPDLQHQENQPAEDPDQNQQSTSTRQVIAKGQTLWSMADQQYNNPYLWPWIYDENKSSISNPDLILAGQTLALPLPGGSNGGLSTDDSLQVAIGYIETYRWYKNHGYGKAKFYLYAARMYKDNVFDYTDVTIDDADLAFANRAR